MAAAAARRPVARALLVIAGLGSHPSQWLARRALRPIATAAARAVRHRRQLPRRRFQLVAGRDREDELGELAGRAQRLGRRCATQRSHLVQRELLLDTVTQNSPVALFWWTVTRTWSLRQSRRAAPVIGGAEPDWDCASRSCLRRTGGVARRGLGQRRQPLHRRDRRRRGDLPSVAAPFLLQGGTSTCTCSSG